MNHTVYWINYKHTVRSTENRWMCWYTWDRVQVECKNHTAWILCYCHQFVQSLSAAATFPGDRVVTRAWAEVSKGTWQMEGVWIQPWLALWERYKVFACEYSCNLLLTWRAIYLHVSGRWHMKLEWGSPVGVWFRDVIAINLECYLIHVYEYLSFAWSFYPSFFPFFLSVFKQVCSIFCLQFMATIWTSNAPYRFCLFF